MFTLLLLTIFIFLVCLSVLILKFGIDSIRRKSKYWGVNLNPVSCPNCHQRVPYIRSPASMRQALWGGWTCSGCGVEMDKWGTDISSNEEFEQSTIIRAKLPEDIKAFDVEGKTPIERVFHEED
jgi:hypothetical protein